MEGAEGTCLIDARTGTAGSSLRRSANLGLGFWTDKKDRQVQKGFKSTSAMLNVLVAELHLNPLF